jgi:glyoxylase-like metal-dependent hydrolase (beta-lactamase superfamily II)
MKRKKTGTNQLAISQSDIRGTSDAPMQITRTFTAGQFYPLVFHSVKRFPVEQRLGGFSFLRSFFPHNLLIFRQSSNYNEDHSCPEEHARRKRMSDESHFIQVARDIYYLDPLKLSPHSVSGIYLIVADGITLIEASTSNIVPHLFDAIHSIGMRPEDIVRCIVTHVHLDHAGAAGWLARRLPHLRIYAHERGVKHLADPSRLLESAQMVYGTPETIQEIHGEILPVPEQHLVAVTDAEIDIGGGTSLRILDAPGHAPHHLCIFDPGSGCLFAGEALGHYHPDLDFILPAVAPPGFDLEASLETSAKIRALNPKTICFSQFGQHHDPAFAIDEAERMTRSYGDLVLASLEGGMGTGEIIEMMFDRVVQDPIAGRFSEQSIRGMLMSIVLGYYQYFQRTGALD